MTQYQKVLFRMLKGPRDKWWFPYEFMRGDPELFVGYEASARLSELARDYPDMIETKQEGKYKVRRILTDNADTWMPQLPTYLREAIEREFS